MSQKWSSQHKTFKIYLTDINWKLLNFYKTLHKFEEFSTISRMYCKEFEIFHNLQIYIFHLIIKVLKTLFRYFKIKLIFITKNNFNSYCQISLKLLKYLEIFLNLLTHCKLLLVFPKLFRSNWYFFSNN